MTKQKNHKAALLFLVTSLVSACGGAENANDGSSSQSQTNPSASGSYVLAWDAIPDARVTGYKLYYATAPFSTATSVRTVDLGPITSIAFNPAAYGVAPGSTVYFGIAATGNGTESALSDQVSVLIQ